MSKPYTITVSNNKEKIQLHDDCYYLMMVLTDANNNNNKFYELKRDSSTNSVDIRYGRVGSEGTRVSSHGFSTMKSKVNEKFNKGYRPVDVAISLNLESNNETILDVAIRDLMLDDNAKIKQLIQNLVQYNKHKIFEMSGGQITIDDSGLVKTPVGILTMSAIDDGLSLLTQLEQIIININPDNYHKFKKSGNYQDLDYSVNDLPKEYFELINKYLICVPQKVNAKRGWADYFFIENNTNFNKQYDFLEQLRVSVADYEIKKQKTAEQQKNKKECPIETVFGYKLKLVEDEKIIKEVEQFFNKTKKSSHESSKLKLKHVYEIITSDEQYNNYEKIKNTKGNEYRYWHGTRKFNILSILKNGLVIPKSNANHVTGRMFGNGVYFSDQSTKSLNYSYGYWDGKSRDHNCYMFIADVIMGKQYNSANLKSNITKYPVKGYDSVFAEGNRINITHNGHKYKLSNNEMIVYNLNQIKLKYLCEFDV